MATTPIVLLSRMTYLTIIKP